MCDPITAISAALAVGGAGASYMGQQAVASARDDALAAERIRQQGYDQQSAALNTQSQDRYQDFGQKQEQKAATLSDYFTGQQAAPGGASLMPQSSSNITVANENARVGEAKANTDKIGTALGDLRSFGDLLGSTNILQARDASKIGQIGGFKKGSANVLPFELEDAQSAGAGWSTAGNVMSGLGRAGMSAGLSGAGGNLFGGGNVVSASSMGGPSSMAFGRAVDRASVPGYAGYQQPGIFSLFGG